MKIWYAAIIFFAVGLDRLVKTWAAKILKSAVTIPVWEGVFHLTYAENRGAAFGMLQGQRIFFLIITVLLTLAVIWILFFRPPENKGFGISFAMILGGALGNFYDRAFFGFVVDMFDFRLINFAVFNVADSFLCVGAALFLLLFIIDDNKKSRAQKAQKTRKGGENADAGISDNG